MGTEHSGATRIEFLREQVAALEPLGYVDVAPDRLPDDGPMRATEAAAPSSPTAPSPPVPPLLVRVERAQEGPTARALVQPIGDDEDDQAGSATDGPGPIPPAVLATLAHLGFTGDPPATAPTADPAVLAVAVDAALTEVLAAPPGTRLDVRHDSRQWVVEAEQRLGAIRNRIEAVLTDLVGPKGTGFELDPEGDFTFPIESTRVFVGTRLLLGGPAVVLVFAPTNIDIEPTPALGLFLARTNAELAFGRFAIDVTHRTVWFGHNLFGDSFTDDELRFVVGVVARTADNLDDQIEKVFGGRLVNPPGQAAKLDEASTTKPAPTGGYL